MKILSSAVCLVVCSAVGVADSHYVSVRDCGAVGDGKTDDSAAFLAAIEQARQAGVPVYVPRGQYVVTRTLTLEGMGMTGPSVGAWPADNDALPSLLVPRAGGPAVHLLAGGSLQGLDLTCTGPEPDETTGSDTVLVSGVGCYVRNVRIRFPWNGIMADGQSNVGRLVIENVFMVSPLNVGVRVTGTWDVPALRNVEVWNAGPVPRGLDRGIGFHLGKNDLLRATDCFVFAMRYGFLLEEQIEGCQVTGGTWGLFTGCSTDFCGTGMCIRGSHQVSISGGCFWDHGEGLLVEGDGARVQLTGAELKSNLTPAVVVRGGDHVVITGCSLLRPMEQYTAPALMHDRGLLTLTGCYLMSCDIGVDIGPHVSACLAQGNMVRALGGESLRNRADPGRVLWQGNLYLGPPGGQ